MSTLHLLSRSPFGDDSFASCLRLLGADDGLLLTGDAVHALQLGTAPRALLEALPAGQPLFALDEDLAARGLATPARVTVVDYAGFVDLSLRFARVNSWL